MLSQTENSSYVLLFCPVCSLEPWPERGRDRRSTVRAGLKTWALVCNLVTTLSCSVSSETWNWDFVVEDFYFFQFPPSLLCQKETILD